MDLISKLLAFLQSIVDYFKGKRDLKVEHDAQQQADSVSAREAVETMDAVETAHTNSPQTQEDFLKRIEGDSA